MFLFNGQYGVASDDNGLYYMRARYYNVSIKRFINQDVVTGSITESQSLNRYAYVEGNPVSYLDPFGLEPLLTDGLHDFAGDVSAVGAFVGRFDPKVGLLIGEAAYLFDTGVYINDIFTSKFDEDVIKSAVKNTTYNRASFAVGFLTGENLLGNINATIEKVNTGISIANAIINKIKKVVKKYIDEQKKKKESREEG